MSHLNEVWRIYMNYILLRLTYYFYACAIIYMSCYFYFFCDDIAILLHYVICNQYKIYWLLMVYFHPDMTNVHENNFEICYQYVIYIKQNTRITMIV